MEALNENYHGFITYIMLRRAKIQSPAAVNAQPSSFSTPACCYTVMLDYFQKYFCSKHEMGDTDDSKTQLHSLQTILCTLKYLQSNDVVNFQLSKFEETFGERR